MFDYLFKANDYLLSHGINITIIIIVVLFVHAVKLGLNNFQFYNEKSKILINIGLGILFSFLICFFINKFQVNGIAIDTLLGASLSVYSVNIMDGIAAIFKKKEGL